MAIDINDMMPGNFWVRFTDGNREMVVCRRVVIDPRGAPIWLETEDGTIYNFQNILSLKKA